MEVTCNGLWDVESPHLEPRDDGCTWERKEKGLKDQMLSFLTPKSEDEVATDYVHTATERLRAAQCTKPTMSTFAAQNGEILQSKPVQIVNTTFCHLPEDPLLSGPWADVRKRQATNCRSPAPANFAFQRPTDQTRRNCGVTWNSSCQLLTRFDFRSTQHKPLSAGRWTWGADRLIWVNAVSSERQPQFIVNVLCVY